MEEAEQRKDIETEKDKAIDLGSQVHHTHLGQIADRIVEWKGEVAEQLKLSPAEIAGIEVKHPKALNLQAREALKKWKQRLGDGATYQKLIDIFEQIKCKEYADFVRQLKIVPTDPKSQEDIPSILQQYRRPVLWTLSVYFLHFVAVAIAIRFVEHELRIPDSHISEVNLFKHLYSAGDSRIYPLPVLSRILYSAVELEIPGKSNQLINASLYVVDSNTTFSCKYQNTPTIKIRYGLSTEKATPRIHYRYREYRLCANSNIHVNVCISEPPVDVYIVKGRHNAGKWRVRSTCDESEACMHIDLSECKNMSYTVHEADDYFVIVLYHKKSHRKDPLIDFNLIIDRWQLSPSIQHPIPNCTANKDRRCMVDIPFPASFTEEYYNILVNTSVPHRNLDWSTEWSIKLSYSRRLPAWLILCSLYTCISFALFIFFSWFIQRFCKLQVH